MKRKDLENAVNKALQEVINNKPVTESNDLFKLVVGVVKEAFGEMTSGESPEKLIKTTYNMIDPNEQNDGDYTDSGWYDEAGQAFDTVEDAIEWLENKGPLEDSDGSGIWYSTIDPERNYKNGQETYYGYHLEGFTPEEAEQVANAIDINYNITHKASSGNVAEVTDLNEAFIKEMSTNKKMSIHDALITAKEQGLNISDDWFALGMDAKRSIITLAKKCEYKKSQNPSSGRTTWYNFYLRLQRESEKSPAVKEGVTFKRSELIATIVETIKTELPKIAKTVVKESGQKVWKARLQKVYSSLEEFEGYCENYGLLKRLGYNSAEEAWDANPIIQGSVDPKDYKVVK